MQEREELEPEQELALEEPVPRSEELGQALLARARGGEVVG